MANRPLRGTVVEKIPTGLDHRIHSSPRSSVASRKNPNVSKRRTLPVQDRYSSRGSDINATLDRGDSPVPSPNIRNRSVAISHEFTSNLAGEINRFTQESKVVQESLKAYYDKKARGYKRGLQKQHDAIRELIVQNQAQAKEINELRSAEKRMIDQAVSLEGEAKESANQLRRLKDKYHTCKEHLNAAIDEHQRLYKEFTGKHEESMRKVTEMKGDNGVAVERAVHQAEAAREQALGQVQKAIAETKSKVQEMSGNINALKQQLVERDVELGREKEVVRLLTTKLEELQAANDGSKSLGVHLTEIMLKLDEQNAHLDDESKRTGQEAGMRFDAVNERLNALSDIISGQPEQLSNLQATDHDLLDSMKSKLQTIIESQKSVDSSADEFSKGMEVRLRGIMQQYDLRNEELSQELCKKAEANGMLSTLFKAEEGKCAALAAEVEELKRDSTEYQVQIRELEDSLFTTETSNRDSAETIRRLQAEISAAKRLSGELEAKSTRLTELEDKLRAKDDAYMSEVHHFTTDVVRLNHMLQEKDAATKFAVEQAAETARREMRVELEQSTSDARRLISQGEQQRDSLAEELKRSKQDICDKEEVVRRDSLTINSLSETLATTKNQNAEMAAGNQRHAHQIEQLQTQKLNKAKALEVELSVARQQVARQEEVKCRDEKSRAVISSLVRWVEKQGISPQIISDLEVIGGGRVGSIGSEETGTRISQVLDTIMMAILKGKPQEPPAEKERLEYGVEDDESSRFFPRRDKAHSSAEPPNNNSQGRLVGQAAVSAAGSFLVGFRGLLLPRDFVALQDQTRRVVVRSPANDQGEPTPPSVDQGRALRKVASQPKPIIRRITRSASQHIKVDNTVSDGAFARSEDFQPPGPLSPDELASKTSSTATDTARARPSTSQNTPKPAQAKRKRPDEPEALGNSGDRAGKGRRLGFDTGEPNHRFDDYVEQREGTTQSAPRKQSKPPRTYGSQKTGAHMVAVDRADGKLQSQLSPRLDSKMEVQPIFSVQPQL
ncbi:hypothetical protein B0H67DRAFT_544020 [Lasiosphaeris hirsuta]|uniref:Uncharacterized protein n=1 Tax=Lasiosphaeris hirsuta TaxID=260670 RepID=A0AA40DQI4_9PEZI|nr:hypothetical protein B0H67DRAFT_544020 [Lasiosphaeris hirsuta]